MRLQVGERLSGSGSGRHAGAYVITGVVRETSWSGLYAAKKVLHNFDFSAKRPRETDDAEWLDVLIRTVQYPHLNDPEYVAARRAMARAEAQVILGRRRSQLWPEPVDFFEIANTRDPLPAAVASTGREPIIVFAHPHGQRLDEWQKQVLPLSSVLSVLGEALEILRQAHDAGMVLNALSPETIWVDRTGRVHFIGTDMIVAPDGVDGVEGMEGVPAWRAKGQTNGVLEQWARYFPAPRYVPGFAAPECFDLSRLPDGRSDLYSWGCLGYYLLTGDDPGKIALEQRCSCPDLGREHYAGMERSLRSVPPSHVRNWAEQLGVNPDLLLAGWPDNVLGLLRQLLQRDARRRPGSVAQARAWLLAPPSPPVAAAVAVRIRDGLAKVLIDVGEATSDVDLVVRRDVGFCPATVEHGEGVYDGPLADIIEDTRAPSGRVHYGVFTRRRSATGTSPSVCTPANLIVSDGAGLLDWAQAQVRDEDIFAPEPACLGLLYQVLDSVQIAEALLGSEFPAVRGWIIQRLSDASQRRPPAEALLWRALLDPEPQLRLAVARGILTAQPPTDSLVRRVVDVLGRGNIDDAIEAALSLQQIGLDEQAVQRAVESLEGDRPAICPVCRVELAGRDRPGHMRSVHGYVEVFGSLLPREVAVERLWDRVFTGADARAHQRLLEMTGQGESDGKSYVAALERTVRSRFPARPGGDRAPADASLATFDGLMSCLGRLADSTLTVELLRSSEPRLRQIARELLLPSLTTAMRGPKLAVHDLRQILDRVIPDDLLEEKILLCLRLPGQGLDESTANVCLAQLQQERPVSCSECRARIRMVDLETHLRRAHGILEFRGVRRPFADMRRWLLERLCSPSPDPAAWRALADIAHDRHPEAQSEADARLLSWLAQTLRDIPRDQRAATFAGLGEVLAGSGEAGRLIPRLLEPHKLPGMQALRHWLALETAAHLHPPVDARLLEAVQPVLADKHLPREVRQAALAALLRAHGKSGLEARDLLLAYVAGTGKLRAIDKLRQVEQLVGQSSEIDRLNAELENQVRMDCPRCGVQLRRLDMVDHLWDRHRLVLDGRCVRDPWRLMEDWLEDYRLEKDQAIMDRCRLLAHKLDPTKGGRRLQRLMLRHGIEDREALAALLERARAKHSTLCPHCYGRIPVEPPEAPCELTLAEESLEGSGYRLSISDRGSIPRLRIESAEEVLDERRAPGRWLTRNGALAFLISPFVLAGFLAFERLGGNRIPPAVALTLAMGLGMVLGGLIFLFWPAPTNMGDRLVDWAWSRLVGELFPEKLGAPELRFLSGLALASRRLGDPHSRAEALLAAREAVDRLARDNPVHAPWLASLWRLAVEDEARLGGDPCRLLAEQVGHCFTGRMPLSYAVLLLRDLDRDDGTADASALWSRARLRRLRLLLCDRAFAAGLELPDLVDLGLVAPELKDALVLDDLEGLTQLRYLWLMQANGPWERIGPAVSAFELAGKPKLGDRALDAFPDLLLAVEGIPLNLCQRGVWFQDVLFATMPAEIEVLARRNQTRSGYELVIGAERFWFDDNPELVARLLEKWFRYFFKDFIVQAGADPGRRSPDASRKLLARNGVNCPDCKTAILPRPGEVGITLDEKLVATWI